MPLQSRLFRGDAKLEAAANVDSAHITPGARGTHVEKIQTALDILDSAGLDVDGIFGPATATAVLNYKSKRDIVNRTYQKTADNIVGKMTMAKLDEQMLAHERKRTARLTITPISPARNQDKASPSLHFQMAASKSLVTGSNPLATRNSVVATNALISPAIFGLITLPVFGIDSVTIDPLQTADIDIRNGAGFTLTLTEFEFATNTPAAVMIVPGVKDPVTRFLMTVNSLRIQVKGLRFGSPILFAQNPSLGPEFTEKLVVNVRDTRPIQFHPTTPHRHEPVKEPDDWNKVCEEAEKDPDLGLTLKALAKVKASPETVVGVARLSLAGKPLANKHFEHYLKGAGATVNEDEHIKKWIENDDNARKVIARRLLSEKANNPTKPHVMFRFEQLMFSNGDAQFSFGAIDNLEAEADFVNGKVDVWFEDTYEWHPVYSQYKKPQPCPDKDKPESKRDTHFGHAALVQMKTRGARDFQMRGKATFPIKLFPGL